MYKGWMPDYSKQLDEIARALSRPAPQIWITVLITSILTFASALLVQVLVRRLDDHSKRKKMRGVLYREVAELFLTVEEIIDFTSVDGTHRDEAGRLTWQKEELKLHAVFNGERYSRANEEVYMQLSERMAADAIYKYFHRALDDVDHLWLLNWSAARHIFARAVHEDRLKKREFRRFFGEDRANLLFRRCSAIHGENRQKLNAMGF